MWFNHFKKGTKYIEKLISKHTTYKDIIKKDNEYIKNLFSKNKINVLKGYDQSQNIVLIDFKKTWIKWLNSNCKEVLWFFENNIVYSKWNNWWYELAFNAISTFKLNNQEENISYFFTSFIETFIDDKSKIWKQMIETHLDTVEKITSTMSWWDIRQLIYLKHISIKQYFGLFKMVKSTNNSENKIDIILVDKIDIESLYEEYSFITSLADFLLVWKNEDYVYYNISYKTNIFKSALSFKHKSNKMFLWLIKDEKLQYIHLMDSYNLNKLISDFFNIEEKIKLQTSENYESNFWNYITNKKTISIFSKQIDKNILVVNVGLPLTIYLQSNNPLSASHTYYYLFTFIINTKTKNNKLININKQFFENVIRYWSVKAFKVLEEYHLSKQYKINPYETFVSDFIKQTDRRAFSWNMHSCDEHQDNIILYINPLYQILMINKSFNFPIAYFIKMKLEGDELKILWSKNCSISQWCSRYDDFESYFWKLKPLSRYLTGIPIEDDFINNYMNEKTKNYLIPQENNLFTKMYFETFKNWNNYYMNVLSSLWKRWCVFSSTRKA